MAVELLHKSLLRYLEELYSKVLDFVGLDVDLYVIRKDVDEQRNLDIYRQSPQRQYHGPFKVKAYINWAPDLYRLKKAGLYVETTPPPLLAYIQYTEELWSFLGYKGSLPIGSYISVPIEMLPENVTVNEFEIVNVKTPHLHGQVEAIVLYELAPRRVK